MTRFYYLFFLTLSACSQLSIADEGFSISAGGMLFGDLYYVSKSHLPNAAESTGWVTRRGVLTANAKAGQSWFGRARVEAFDTGSAGDYDLTGQGRDLYIGRKLGQHTVTGGLIPTISYDVIEHYWNKRYLVRLAPDLHGIPSRDLGISLKGKISNDSHVSYRLMYGSSATWEADHNAYDKFMGAVVFQPTEESLFELYVDQEPRPGNHDRSTAQVFAGRKTEQYFMGVLYTHQDRQSDPPLEVAALLGTLKVTSSASLVSQFHYLLEPSPKGNSITYLPFDPTARASNIVAGIEFSLGHHLLITPNVAWTVYDQNSQGVRPEDDLQVRLTVFFNFE